MKRNNFNTLIREEMKNRFEGAVKEEIADYRNSREEIEKRFSFLNDCIKLMRSEVESLRRDNEIRCQTLSEQFIKEKADLENSFDEQRRTIRTVQKEIRETVDVFNKTRSDYSTNEVIQNHVDALVGLISLIKVENHHDKEEIKNCIDLKVKELDCKCSEENRLSNANVGSLLNKLDKFNKIIDDFGVSVEGFTREITVMKKGEFILEKNIENLYTQIDRLKKHIGGVS